MFSTPDITMDLIEQYVLGQLDVEQSRLVEAAGVKDSEVRSTIDALREGLEQEVRQNAVAPPAGVKERLLSRLEIPETQRLDWPPVIHAGSKVTDFARWIDGPGMDRPADAEEVHAIPFADNAQGMSALVWLVQGSPEETHTDLVEKFLIVEGTCEISMRGEVFSLSPGDVLSIPLYTAHSVKVTSLIPCKVILQRIAA